MLPITTKIRSLVDELDEAIKWCKDFEFVLVNGRNGSQFIERVEALVSKLPNFNILTAEKKGMLDIVRKVCTGELSRYKAHDLVYKYHEDLKYTRSLINL